ncbi:Fc.00g099430.m01.CDS01 [Cosmosporella sp. VM-42]
MAFHQPTRQSIQRVVRPATDEPEAPRLQPAVPSDRTPDESQTWVLFAPTEVTATSYLSETDQSLETPGRSRAGDLGSLSAARSEQGVESRQSASISAIEDEELEDDAELDSLDSHLPEFRSLPGIYSQSQNDNQQSIPVFPSHDGLGSFRLDQPTLGAEAQDQIYQFEQFNPRRVRRRQESFDLAQLQLEQEEVQEAEKRRRIEEWRLEHSRVLLSEIQRETRRRRQSQASLHRRTSSNTVPVTPQRTQDAESDNMTWHDEDAVETPDESQGFLARITRKVLREVMGIDERMLSVLFGDAVPDEDDLSTTPRASQLGMQPPQSAANSTWQLDMLEKVSRELGLLVNQLSHHPGAFSTYTRVQQMPLPYAGLPIIPESNLSHSAADHIAHADPEQSSFPQFQPTMKPSSRPIDIPGRPTDPSIEAAQALRQDIPMSNTFTQEEWEKDLDIKLVFRYLRSRFLSHENHSPPLGTSHLATSSTQDTAAKVARVRQHHPLISRVRPPADRRVFKATTPSSPVALRHPSSCASQSTRRSARRSSVSSRHYWDIGGSLGTGSMIASNGPMGSWGEV